jgi:hypothetical protein
MTTVPEVPDELDESGQPDEPEEYEPSGVSPELRDDADEGDIAEQVLDIADDEADDYR